MKCNNEWKVLSYIKCMKTGILDNTHTHTEIYNQMVLRRDMDKGWPEGEFA